MHDFVTIELNKLFKTAEHDLDNCQSDLEITYRKIKEFLNQEFGKEQGEKRLAVEFGLSLLLELSYIFLS